MVELLNLVKSVSSQEQVTGISSSSHADNGNLSKNSIGLELRDVKKKEVAMEKVKNASKETVERTVQALKNYIESNKRSLDITVHEETGSIMVKVISEQDGKVIREMPPEKFLDLAAKIEELAGSLFDETA